MKEVIEIEDSEPVNVGSPEGVDILPGVAPFESGFGHPYAPQNWPNYGDNWRWKVGSRITKRDQHADRYLYAPKHLPPPRAFFSRASLERYIRNEFPGKDLEEFFAMFSWNIPARKPVSPLSDSTAFSYPNSSVDMKADYKSVSQSTKCPAGRKSCKGLLLEAQKLTMPCDICCKQSDFCRHCSCILCSKTVKCAFEGYSFFRCETAVDEKYVCGHVAHLICALRCNMAGTLGGNFKLDAAYYCRRCDAKSDLVPHVTKFLEICKSVDSGIELEKILRLGIDILRGSEREPAQVLLCVLEAALSEVKNGGSLISNWEAEESVTVMPMSGLNSGSEVKTQTTTMDSPVFRTKEKNSVSNSPDEQEINPLKLEDEICITLQSLKKSQEAEYRQAEEKLHEQKTYLINLQEQLQHEKSQLAALSPSTEPSANLNTVKNRTEQIRRELNKLKEMQEVYKLFRKVY